MKTSMLATLFLLAACASSGDPETSASPAEPAAGVSASPPAAAKPAPSKDASAEPDDERDPHDCTGLPDRTPCDNGFGQCVGGACEKLESCYGDSPQEFLHCYAGTASVRDTSTSLYPASRVSTYACASGEVAAEVAFEMNEDTTQTVTVTLEVTDGSAADLDLLVLEGDCKGVSKCAGSSLGAGAGSESVTFTAAANKTYYVVVDGKSATPASFHVGVDCK